MNIDLLMRFLLECFLLLEWNNAISTTTNDGEGSPKIDSNVYKGGSDGCITSADCAFNGECVKDNEGRLATKISFDPEAPGVCQCFDGWKGATCEVLDVLPVDPQKVGLVLPNHDSSTWGGSVVYDEESDLYHMFASEILYDCGLYSGTTNSQVIRAVSKSPYGPYEKVQVIVPVFAHDANIIRAPTGEFVLYVTALEGVEPMDCRNQTQSIEVSSIRNGRYLRSSPRAKSGETVDIVDDEDDVPPKDTYMLWAPNPEGPWSEPVMVLNSTIYNSDYWKKYNKTAKCDSNLNGIILPSDNNDGKQSFLGLWRRCETDELLTIPHVMVASDWKNASTYQPILSPLFVLAGSGAEDPSNIWTTKTSDMKPGQVAYHAIFHDEQATRCMLGACGGQGRHAVSLDGTAWKYASVNAYERHFSWKTSDDTNQINRSDTRARPHMVLAPTKPGGDPWHQTPIALSTGLKATDESGYVYTLVQPLRSSEEYSFE